jgi:hypothetical protein
LVEIGKKWTNKILNFNVTSLNHPPIVTLWKEFEV